MKTTPRKALVCSTAVVAAVSIALTMSVTMSVASAQEPDKAWKIGPRTLPPPDGASAKLRQMLADSPAPSGPAFPTDRDALQKQIAAGDAERAAKADALLKELKLDVKEQNMAGVRVYRLTPPQVAPEHAHRLFVHIHGGAFIAGRGRAGLPEAAQIAYCLKMPVLSIDYRMAPDHPAPAALDDVIAVWHEVLKTHTPANVALGGTSAGGNLTMVATLKMQELKLDVPAALFVGTPAVDMAKRGDARFINEGIDKNLVSWDRMWSVLAIYVGDKRLDDPYISPIFGDFKGFPPTYLISGTCDLMLSDTVRARRKLRQAGVEADLHVYEGLAHAQYAQLMDTPECAEHYAELTAFVSHHLAR